MRRLLAIVLIVPVAVLAATGGPDASGILFSSSEEPTGPPHALLDLSAAADLGLEAGESAELALPFEFSWGDGTWESATVSASGALFFGDVPSARSCPGADGTWSGVAALWDDLGAGEVRTATFGRYPYRAFAVEWHSPHATIGGHATVQAWLTEGRDEAVVVLDDLVFGDASVDGGASAVVGVQSGAGTGLVWSCSGGLADGQSAWFGPQGTRPSAPERATGDLAYALAGPTAYDYVGRAVAAGELNGDGLSDVAVGAQDADQVFVVSGGLDRAGGDLAYADAVISGTSGEDLGAALAVADLDGDGLDELAIGAPTSDTAGSQAGAVYVLLGGGLPVAVAVPTDADLVLRGPATAGKPRAGAALAAADLDGDGYGDLAIGAPRADTAATDAGAVYLWAGSASLSGSASLTDADGTLLGATAQDLAGTALAAGDLDGDGLAELGVSAPYFAGSSGGSSVAHAGRVYLVAGSTTFASGALSALATASFTGDSADDRLGISLAFGDLDGDGEGDLAAGAPYVDDTAGDGGALYLFLGVSALSGDHAASEADGEVIGTTTSANVGQTVAIGDLSMDGQPDLVVAAPNGSGGASGGGLVGVFIEAISGTVEIADADHLLSGDESAGAAGTALAVAADHTGDGGPDLVVGVPYSSPTGTLGGGTVYLWSFVPDFWDEDDDGFVAIASGGVDCDDGDPDIWPGRAEIDDNGLDDDCDGWVDGTVIPRVVEEGWLWDLNDELPGATPVDYGFEEAAEGDDPSDLYEGEGILLSATGDLVLGTEVWGSLPVDTLGVHVSSTSAANDVTLSFGEDIDALSMRILDADLPFYLFAYGDGATVADKVELSADGDNRTGGVFLGLTFAVPVDTVRLAGLTDDGWGLDALQIVWSDDTDRDLDGLTDNEGDCDDADAAINPSASEILDNGVDDDCDGVIDAGSLTIYEDLVSWASDTEISPDWIDFEDLADGELVEEQYQSLGVHFDGELYAGADVDGSAPRDALAGEVTGSSVTLQFEELQPALVLYVLDASGSITLTGSVEGAEVYDVTVDLSGDDVDGGVFLGLAFDYGVDTLTLTSESSFDLWGIDDVGIVPLGQDDADGDGYTEAEGDCDDTDADTSPDAVEVYYDGVDSDCDEASDYDADGDGFDNTTGGGIDCDDSSASTNPDAEETWYDGTDEDCDGASDYDADEDGHDDIAWGGDDCDDGDDDVNPDEDEIWYDGEDKDCDGASDYDRDGDGFVSAAYADAVATDPTVSTGDCDDGEESSNPDATDEPYDGVDSDCDGSNDYDVDEDGHESVTYGGDDCDDREATSYPGSPHERCYDDEDSDCLDDDDWDCDADGYTIDSHSGSDCDDSDAEIHPGVSDPAHDGVDANCDGALEYDDDEDGWDGAEDGGEDCDDEDAAINPDAAEICYNGVDENCDEAAEDDCDSDGYAADFLGGTDCADEDGGIYPGATDYPYDDIDQDCDEADDFDVDGDGYTADWYGGGDCDDEDATAYPGAPDAWYDGVDSDCADDDDFDGDLDGFVLEVDCDDSDPAVNPEETEVVGDGTDQDCDGLDDVDADGDGSLSAVDCEEGDAAISPLAEEICADGTDQDCDGSDLWDCDGDGVDGELSGGSDCDDADAAVSPGADERWYDGVDQDCDGADDYDQDGDGFTAELWGGRDCDDTDAGVSPDVLVDGCGGGDEDCDGGVDEDCAVDSGEDTDTGEDSGTDSGEDSAEDSDSGGDTDGPGGGGNSWEEEPKTGCGCAVAASGGAWAWLGLLVGLVWRRRSRVLGSHS